MSSTLSNPLHIHFQDDQRGRYCSYTLEETTLEISYGGTSTIGQQREMEFASNAQGCRWIWQSAKRLTHRGYERAEATAHGWSELIKRCEADRERRFAEGIERERVAAAAWAEQRRAADNRRAAARERRVPPATASRMAVDPPAAATSTSQAEQDRGRERMRGGDEAAASPAPRSLWQRIKSALGGGDGGAR